MSNCGVSKMSSWLTNPLFPLCAKEATEPTHWSVRKRPVEAAAPSRVSTSFM